MNRQSRGYRLGMMVAALIAAGAFFARWYAHRSEGWALPAIGLAILAAVVARRFLLRD